MEDLVNEIKHLPYNLKPGTKFQYSNSGYVLLGYIIEKVTKKSYEEYICQNIFEKLLANCGFIDMSIPYSAGALYSTVEDVHIWNNKLAKGEIISEYSFIQMFSRQVKTKNFYYGYGVYMNDVELGGKVRKKVWHRGEVSGFYSINIIFPDDDIQIIMMTNICDEGFFSKTSKVEAILFEDKL